MQGGCLGFINYKRATSFVPFTTGALIMDKEFLNALRRLKKQARDAEQAFLSYLIEMAELEAKQKQKAA